MIAIFFIGIASISCKSQKSAVEKRTHKKRKMNGSMDCPMKDC